MILRLADEPLPDNYRIKTKTYRIVSIGSLDERKGHARLLRIALRLKKEGFDFELWILGKGILYSKLEAFIIENGLTENVHLLGYKENPYKFLKAADIYVCCSFAEGYNTAITEALVLGKAVVSTECSGVKEQLGVDNVFGICTANTEKDLYIGMKTMFQPKMLEYYTQKAKKKGEDFTLINSMKEIYGVIGD